VSRRLRGLAAAAVAASAILTFAARAGAQGDPAGTATSTGAPSTAPTSTAAPAAASVPDDPVGITTSTLPEDNSEVGRIIPLPDSGREPSDPGDRGGWQQVALFFAICAVIVGIGAYVWWRGRRNRARLRAEGLDRVEWARSHGGDVRSGQ
jgi:hypothetical protein